MERTLAEDLRSMSVPQEDVKGACVFNSKAYTPVSFSKLSVIRPERSEGRKVTYIDGGQQAIFSSSSFLIGIVRTAASSWKGTIRQEMDVKEFLVLIRRGLQQRKVTYYTLEGERTRPFPTGFFSYEKVREEGSDMEETLSGIRRHAELSLAQGSVKISEIVCIDGSLRTFSKEEYKTYEEVRDACERSGTVFAGLQKTTSLMTDSGRSLAELHDVIGKEEWMTTPLCKNENQYHEASVHAVKLHKRADHILVLDVAEGMASRPVLDELVSNSCDPLFLGYPYGLIDADRLARIEEQRREQLRIDVRRGIGSQNEFLTEEIRSQDAHEILDRISF